MTCGECCLELEVAGCILQYITDEVIYKCIQDDGLLKYIRKWLCITMHVSLVVVRALLDIQQHIHSDLPIFLPACIQKLPSF